MPIKDVLERCSKDANKTLKKTLSDKDNKVDYDVVLTGDKKCLSDSTIVIPTRSNVLNKLLDGGIKCGRVYEIFGPFSIGKSTIAQEIMCAVQQYPGVSMMLDSERTWNRKRAIAQGHNPDNHIHIETTSLEHGIESIDTFVTNLRMPGKGISLTTPIVCVWDTLSSSGTIADIAGDFSSGMMDKPRKLRDLWRKWSDFLPRMNVALVFVTQTHVAPPKKGSKAPAKTKTDGGSAVKIWASQRLELYRESNTKISYPYKDAGYIVSVKTVKDKFNPPWQTIYLPLIYKTGISGDYDIVNFILDNDKKKKYGYKDANDFMVTDYLEEDGKQYDLAINMKKIPEAFENEEGLKDYLIECVNDLWSTYYY